MERGVPLSKAALLSMCLSALTTGLTSKNISRNYDLEPMRRKNTPSFYGYLPRDTTKRTIMGVCMVLSSTALLLLRSFGAAMLMLAEKRYFVLYMAGDMGLYLLQKVLRGDFHYWTPIDGVVGLIVSLVARMGIKTITDFTGLIQFRHPGELGGLYWTVNMFLALVASVASVWVYYEKGEGLGMEQSTAWLLVGLLCGLWTVSFGVFFVLMKKEYRRTFISTELGKQQSMNLFIKGENDETKVAMFSDNKLRWATIRPQVKEWTLERWPVWQAQKPEFFTPNFIARMPLDMVPIGAQGEAKEVRKQVRRRSMRSVSMRSVREVLPVFDAAAEAGDGAVDEEIVLFVHPTPKQLQQNRDKQRVRNEEGRSVEAVDEERGAVAVACGDS